MKRFYILLIFFVSTKFYSQQIELGPTLGYGFSNIVNSNSDNDRAVIGDALWNANYGISSVYYFKDINYNGSTRIGLLYKRSKRGSRSEINKNNFFEINTSTVGFFIGYAGQVEKGFSFYIDIGFGRNSLEKSEFYFGGTEQTQAFEDLDSDLEIKENEATFIYAIGLEKYIIKNKLKAYFEINGDAGISQINQSNGKYRTQSLNFGIGVRYVLKLKK